MHKPSTILGAPSAAPRVPHPAAVGADPTPTVQTETGRSTVSALITCFNEQGRIASCIESLLWCDDILVVDSFSTDNTAALAKAFPKVRLLQRPYTAAAEQKNWAMRQVKSEWILIFDADEVCTPALRDEIVRTLRQSHGCDVFAIRRRTFFLGRRIRFSGWQNDTVRRLFRRGHARYPEQQVHADLETDGSVQVLDNPMEHFMVDALPEFVGRFARYSHWGAANVYRSGRSILWPRLLLDPAGRFVRTYIVQLGFLDGVRGLIFCGMQAAYTFHKLAIAWSWQESEQHGVKPVIPPFRQGRT